MIRTEEDGQYSALAQCDCALEKHCSCNQEGPVTILVNSAKEMATRVRDAFKRNLLVILTVVGIVLGFSLGFGIRALRPSNDALMWIRLPGEVFLRLLQMMIVPIVVTNVISGTASLDPKANGMISWVAFAYILGTNIVSCLVAVVLSVTIRPGELVGVNTTDPIRSAPKNSLETQDIFADLIRNLFPDNIVAATFRKVVTQRVNVSASEPLKRTLEFTDRSNILGLIFACMMFGIATSMAKEKGKPFLNFFKSAGAVVLIILQWFLWYAPVGICSLIAASLARIDDLAVIFQSLGFFVLTVAFGEFILQTIILPLIHFIASRENPFRLLLLMHRAWFVSFASTSTAIAMPEIIICLIKYGADGRVAQFAVPFSVTLSANGSAIFIVCAALFLGQLAGVAADVGQVITVAILTAVSCMALPPVPSASLVSLVIVMTSVGLPIEQLGLLFTVEWFLDRIRSGANAVSHTYCGAFTYSVCRSKIDVLPDDVSLEYQIDENTDKVEDEHKVISTMWNSVTNSLTTKNEDDKSGKPIPNSTRL